MAPSKRRSRRSPARQEHRRFGECMCVVTSSSILTGESLCVDVPAENIGWKAIGARALSALRQRVLRLLEVFSPIDGVGPDSNVSLHASVFTPFQHEQVMRSRAEEEFRKAQVLAWYMQQKSKMT